MIKSPISKAIAGALVTIIVGLLTKYGIVLTPEVSGAVDVLLNVVIAGAIGFLGVYFAPKNKEV
jgi:hypothetical protein